jgi:hypothetical protein
MRRSMVRGAAAAPRGALICIAERPVPADEAILLEAVIEDAAIK